MTEEEELTDDELDAVEEAEDEAITIKDQLTEPFAVVRSTHPMIPYGEQAHKVKVRGREFLVKESDLHLIDLTPVEKHSWRKDGITDYSVVAHRGFMRREGKAKDWRFIPYNPANLGFYDASRNKQISATYEIDRNKVSTIHKLWREHLNLVRQWYKVDTIISEDHDLDEWARRHSKRMHPLIRMYYRVKKACDRLEEIADRAPDDSMACKRMADMAAKQLEVAMRIESMIHTTGKYLDAILERRIKDRKKDAKDGKTIDADAEVVPDMENVRLKDVDREIARIRDEFTGDSDDIARVEDEEADS